MSIFKQQFLNLHNYFLNLQLYTRLTVFLQFRQPVALPFYAIDQFGESVCSQTFGVLPSREFHCDYIVVCVLCTHCCLCFHILIYTFFSHTCCCWFTWKKFDVCVSVFFYIDITLFHRQYCCQIKINTNFYLGKIKREEQKHKIIN